VGSVVFREYFDRHVPEDRGRLGLGATIIRALWEEDGLSARELSDQLQVSPHLVESTASRLERAKWIRYPRQPDSDDLNIPLQLTDLGRSSKEKFASFGQLTRWRLEMGLTPTDRKILNQELSASSPAR